MYGWAALADSTRSLSELERLYEGAVLGNPTAIAEGRDGRVFVLDAGFKKVVVFSREGEFEGVITGGAGEGPGEFQFPNQIVLGPGRDLWISDLHLQRISRFSQDGELLATIPVPSAVSPRMLTMSATDSALYAVRHARDSVPVLIALDSAGAVRGEVVWPTSEDIRFGGSRLAIGVGRGRGGSLVVAHTDVGTWSQVEGLIQSDRRGHPLYPEAQPWEKVDPQYGIRTTEVAAQPSHAGGFSDGTVFVRFLENGSQLDGFKLALYDSTGTLLSVLDSAGFGGAFGHSVQDKTVYFVE
ncbi:MAG: 6-bladed beta-propeller, partial [Gemmatimonadetes bacterium]|nr:6-bladed beta-propeller [Gemmatimonadota bacterium]